MRRLFAGTHRPANGLPGLQAAAEHAHRSMADPFEHPPRAVAVVGAVAVVNHGQHAIGKPDAGQLGGEFFSFR